MPHGGDESCYKCFGLFVASKSTKQVEVTDTAQY
jgi:hypothetical protein